MRYVVIYYDGNNIKARIVDDKDDEFAPEELSNDGTLSDLPLDHDVMAVIELDGDEARPSVYIDGAEAAVDFRDI